MGGTSSKNKRQKQKKKPVAHQANDEAAPPRDSALKPEVNAPPENKDFKPAPHEQEEIQHNNIARAATPKKKQEQNQDTIGQIEQQHTGTKKKPTNFRDSQDNTEVRFQSLDIHHFISSERKDRGKKQASASHFIKKGIQPKPSKEKQAGSVTKLDVQSQVPVLPICLPSHKEQKDLDTNVPNQDIVLNTTVPTKHTEVSDQPEDGSKSSHHTETRATIQGTSQQPTDTGKGENETHHKKFSKPSTREMFPPQETATLQLLEVRNGSTEDAKSPTQCQASGDSSPNAPLLSKETFSDEETHSKTTNKSNKLDEAQSQATKNSERNVEHIHENPGKQQFTLNQRCPHKAHCGLNSGGGPSPNVRKGFDENYLSEASWITTAKVAAFVALRKIEDTEMQMYK